MYSQETIDSTLELKNSGKNLSQISKEIGISRSTIREWFSETKRYTKKTNKDKRSNYFFENFEDSVDFRKSYYYLLGQYLGDGTISRNGNSYALRIFATRKYSNIIEEISNSMKIILPNNKVYCYKHSENCIAVTISSNMLPVIFPHCGKGKKHERDIVLSPWQLKYFNENSKYLARGLFHSDGYFGEYSYSGFSRNMYGFSNCSLDIHNIYKKCLDVNNIIYRFNNKKIDENRAKAWNTLIIRKNEVKKAFEFLGRKS